MPWFSEIHSNIKVSHLNVLPCIFSDLILFFYSLSFFFIQSWWQVSLTFVNWQSNITSTYPSCKKWIKFTRLNFHIDKLPRAHLDIAILNVQVIIPIFHASSPKQKLFTYNNFYEFGESHRTCSRKLYHLIDTSVKFELERLSSFVSFH